MGQVWTQLVNDIPENELNSKKINHEKYFQSKLFRCEWRSIESLELKNKLQTPRLARRS
jgi:hypothetical protein